jgi:hypothetical protein
MEEAGLWTDGLLDNREWWDSKGELNGVALFTHAHVQPIHFPNNPF